MNKLFSYIAGIFIAPRSTLNTIASRRPLGAAIIVFIFTSLISSTAGLATLPSNSPLRAGSLFPAIFIGSLLFGILTWFLQTGIYHLFAEFLGGRGSAFTLFTTLPFTSLPGIIMGPLGLLISTLGHPYLSIPLSLALFIWILLLQIWALKAIYSLSGPRAAAAILLPFAALMAAVIIFTLTLLTTLLPIIIQALPEFPLTL